ncbi:MAG: hypothetical protein AAFY60_10070, partial [Myxococcota bacterium]
TVQLERPLFIAGENDGLIRRAAFTLSSLNGWRLTLIDDLLQHRCGLTAHAYRAENGRRDAEHACEQALKSAWLKGPPSVIGLPAGWVPKRVMRRQWRRQEATLVVVESRPKLPPEMDSDAKRALDERAVYRADAIVGLPRSPSDTLINERILHALGL